MAQKPLIVTNIPLLYKQLMEQSELDSHMAKDIVSHISNYLDFIPQLVFGCGYCFNPSLCSCKNTPITNDIKTVIDTNVDSFIKFRTLMAKLSPLKTKFQKKIDVNTYLAHKEMYDAQVESLIEKHDCSVIYHKSL